MVMVVFEVAGNCRTCSLKPAIPPMRRINRLTTLASTGRRMKRSVKAFIGARSRSRRFRRRWKRGAFVDCHWHIGLQLDLAGGHHPLARLHALFDRNPLAAHGAEAHEAALDDEAGCGTFVDDGRLGA